jgi:signal transduction histidine kinase
MNTLLCPWEQAQYLVYSSNIPTLFFYSHIPAVLIALLLGIIILRKGHQSPVSIFLFIITLLFSLWCVIDLVLWATNRPDMVMFYWSLQVLLEPLIYAASVYFAYLFITGKDIAFYGKLIMFVMLLPCTIFLSSNLTLIGVDLADCNAFEGPISMYYSYIFELISIITILVMVIYNRKKTLDLNRKKEIGYFGIGIIFFLLAFSWGNIIGSFTDNWSLAQAGLIGMPIFFGFLAYISVKFKTFNLKILGAQVLVFALGFLVLSISFVRKIQNIRIVIFFTLTFVIILGYRLIRVVKKEVKQREQLEILSEQLLAANDKLKELDKLKTEFISLATHQIRSPLTAIKGYASMVLDGSYGELSPKVKEAIDIIMQSSANLAITIEDFLNVSKIESGGMQYEKVNFDLGEMTKSMTKGIAINAEKKGLKIDYTDDQTGPYMINGDQEKLRQVVLNFIDNSIKYTKAGEIHVSVTRFGTKVHFAVKDTGMGMTMDIKSKLFHKFSRGDGQRMNTTGSGLGLYLAKEIAKAHGGDVGVDSAGPGLGSTFYMDLESVK